MLFLPEASTNRGQSAVAFSFAFQASSHYGRLPFPLLFIYGHQSACSVLVRIFRTGNPFYRENIQSLHVTAVIRVFSH